MAQLWSQYLVDNFASLLKTVLSEVNMHRVVGGDPLLLQRRAKVMDAYSRLQHSQWPPSTPSQFAWLSVAVLRLGRWQNGIENIIAGWHHWCSCWRGGEAPHPLLPPHRHGHADCKPAPSLGNFLWSRTCAQNNMFFQGSTTMIIILRHWPP